MYGSFLKINVFSTKKIKTTEKYTTVIIFLPEMKS